MTAFNLQSENIAAGTTLRLETGALPGGALELTAFAPPARYLPLTSAKTDTGVGLTATAAGGAMGISRTAGTSLQLSGEATSASAKTDKALFEFDLPDTYNSGSVVPVTVNAAISGSGTLTAASCTMLLAAYSETNGVEAALTVTPSTAQQITAAGANINWSIAGAGLVAGAHLAIEITQLITSSTGANAGVVNGVSIQA